MDVSSVHSPGWRLKGPPPIMSVTGSNEPRELNSTAVLTASPAARPSRAPWYRSSWLGHLVASFSVDSNCASQSISVFRFTRSSYVRCWPDAVLWPPFTLAHRSFSPGVHHPGSLTPNDRSRTGPLSVSRGNSGALVAALCRLSRLIWRPTVSAVRRAKRSLGMINHYASCTTASRATTDTISIRR